MAIVIVKKTIKRGDLQLVGVNFLCIWKEWEVVLSEEHYKYEWISLSEIIERNWNGERYYKCFEFYSE